ncbi:MAG: S9 family peptidase [Thermomicrobiales bacterium]
MAKTSTRESSSTKSPFRTIAEPNWSLTSAAASSPPVRRRTGRPLEIDDLHNLITVGEPAVSPDGTRTVVSVTTVNKDDNKYVSALWLFALDGTPARRLTGGNWTDATPAWSPNGESIAFTSNRAGKSANLWILPSKGGEARQVTDLENGVGDIGWAPDSARLVFTSRVSPDGFDSDHDVRVITSVRYKFDGKGFLDGKISHIWTIDTTTESAQPTQLTSGAHPHEFPVWSPSGREIAFVANLTDDWDQSRISDIWSIPASGGTPKRLTDGRGSYHAPAWSPDGTRLVISGNAKLTPGAQDTDLFLLGASGGKPKRIAKDFGRSFGVYGSGSPRWSADGSAILITVPDRGNDFIARIDLEVDTVTCLTPAGRSITGFAAVPGGKEVVATVSDATTPAELVRVTARKEHRLSTFNENWMRGVAVPVPEELWIESGDELIQGWLIRPAGNTAEGPLVPAIVHIHGGPHMQVGPSFSHELQMFAARGSAIVYVNARGSAGRDEAFTAAVTGNWGTPDMPDQLAATDHIVELGGIDPDRIGITGGSYGGFMTNWILSHSDRYKVGVTDRSISNLISMYGTDDISLVSFDPEMGTPWDNLDRYWDMSPLKYVANIKVPLLIVHSENDYRCPMEQGEQLFMALKKLGGVTEFVRFQNESHGLSRGGQPKHRVERLERTLGWFYTYL